MLLSFDNLHVAWAALAAGLSQRGRESAPPDVLPGGFLLAMAHEDTLPQIPGRNEPSTWEDREGFRETLLFHFTRPGDAEAMRRFGTVLYDWALESSAAWPTWPEGVTRSELRAAAADLRHLEGFLASVGQEHRVSDLGFEESTLSRFAARQAREVGRIADRIEKELAAWLAAEDEG